MKIRNNYLLFFLMIIISPTVAQNSMHPWEIFEISVESQQQFTAPYVDGLQEGEDGFIKAIFTRLDSTGSDKDYSITGFWDGGNTWKIRFAPPSPGKWGYRTISKDASINGKTGELLCQAWDENALKENPTRRGFVRVCKTGSHPGRYFEYTDGTPFLWIGDTWWNWTKNGIKLESFKKLADDRSAKSFTVGQLFFAGRGWGQESSLLDKTYTKPDIEHIHAVEEMIRYANSKGITMWVHGWWGSKNLDQSPGAETMRRWWRYMVHRLSAYNVIWVEAGEYNIDNYGGLGLEFWNSLGELIKKEDPYQRILSVHPTPPGWSSGAEAPQWSTAEVIHNQNWLDYNQSQVGHSKWRNERIPAVVSQSYAMNPPKPVVVTEPWYEFIKDAPAAADIRFGAWSAMMSGAAGHTYGGGQVWKAHVPESPADKDSWPMEMNFEVNTLDYPGAQSISYLAKFLKSTAWWQMAPHPELVKENPSPYCLAKPGEEYVIFLRWGGYMLFDLQTTAKDSSFHYAWIDLTQEKIRKEGDIQGGAIRELNPPEDYPGTFEYKDWIVHIKKK